MRISRVFANMLRICWNFKNHYLLLLLLFRSRRSAFSFSHCNRKVHTTIQNVNFWWQKLREKRKNGKHINGDWLSLVLGSCIHGNSINVFKFNMHEIFSFYFVLFRLNFSMNWFLFFCVLSRFWHYLRSNISVPFLLPFLFIIFHVLVLCNFRFFFISSTQFTFVVVSYFEFNQLLNVMYLVQLGFSVVFRLDSNVAIGHGSVEEQKKKKCFVTCRIMRA